MKAKIVRGKNFKGVLKYVSDRSESCNGSKHAEYVGGTVLHGSIKEMTKEMNVPLRIRTVKKPVYHISLSMPKGESRRPIEEWKILAECFMEKMDFDKDTLWCAYRHNDTDCDHIHIVANRVSLSGEVYLGQKDVDKAIEVTQQMEEEYNLTLTEGLWDKRNRMSEKERQMITRTQTLSDKQVVKFHVSKAMNCCACFEDFELYLKDRGISVNLNRSKTLKISGISFEMNGFAVKGSQLGSDFSWNKLGKKLPILSDGLVSNKSIEKINTRTRRR